jgi:hypothetical protein
MALYLTFFAPTVCFATEWPKPDSGLYNWYRSDADGNLVKQRFAKASIKPLGTKKDITEISQRILSNPDHVCSVVRELRWLDSRHAMAKAGEYGPSLGSSEYTFVLEKKHGAWTIIACYMEWRS